MGAPSATARTSPPSGIPLRDGFATMITFENDPDVSLWEKATTPGGVDGGDAIEQTSFHNVAVRTKWPRSLYEETDGSITCGYDPVVYDQIVAMINVNQTITVTWNDGTTRAHWGFFKSFVPQEVSDGEQPEASVEFVVTNLDNTFLEEVPVIVEVSGT